MGNLVTLSIYLPETLKDEMKEIATEEERSISKTAKILIELGIKYRKKQL